jgi:hypothetical protein
MYAGVFVFAGGRMEKHFMDIAAVTELRARSIEAINAAEKYRAMAASVPAQRDFYHALAVTYERSVREMQIMLDTVDRLGAADQEAA